MGGGIEELKPAIAMFGLQFTYAGVSLLTRGALLQGMSPRVFVVYRQAIAALFIAPVAFFSSRGQSNRTSMGLKSFSLIFMASLIGVTINQNIFFEGLYLGSSSLASAATNLVPAITFIMATALGLEHVNIRSLRSIAKIFGTALCVGGAIIMAFLRGPKILNSDHFPLLSSSTLFSLQSGSNGDHWIAGCFFLFGSCCCWSIWLILQVPMNASYPNPLSMSAWMCFMSTLQSAALTLFLERDLNAWKLNSSLQWACCIYAGVIGSGISFYVQAWCIARRGPLFSAMFNPLCTVIVTFFAAIFLNEEIYTGSMAGAAAVVAGLYVVLWGKAKENAAIVKMIDGQEPDLKINNGGIEKSTCTIDLEEPLLSSDALLTTEIHKDCV